MRSMCLWAVRDYRLGGFKLHVQRANNDTVAWSIETYSRSGIEVMGEGVQLLLGVAGHVGALGQVPAQQPIGVLVGPRSRRAIRIRKKPRIASRCARCSCSAISVPRS